MSDALPILAITMGDPAGVGPELAARAAMRAEVRGLCRPLIVGDAGVVRQAARLIGLNLDVRSVTDVSAATFAAHGIDVYDLANVDLAAMKLGQISAMAGHAAFEAVRVGIELASAGKVAGVVTCPIHKEALSQAGHKFPGHTEIFAHFTGVPDADVTMMLAAGHFRVVHVSTHVSLRKACDAVTRQRVRKVIGLADSACRALGVDKPKIGVAGLNPHASDGGLFGDEEREHIRPAVEEAVKDGIDARGPMPPDTFYAMAVGGAFDCCVAMYHDQGHIPVKMTGFKYDASKSAWTDVRGINVSLGLPIVRTSVDHGTAFDQAGKGTASDASLIDAIEYAARLAKVRADDAVRR